MDQFKKITIFLGMILILTFVVQKEYPFKPRLISESYPKDLFDELMEVFGIDVKVPTYLPEDFVIEDVSLHRYGNRGSVQFIYIKDGDQLKNTMIEMNVYKMESRTDLEEAMTTNDREGIRTWEEDHQNGKKRYWSKRPFHSAENIVILLVNDLIYHFRTYDLYMDELLEIAESI